MIGADNVPENIIVARIVQDIIWEEWKDEIFQFIESDDKAIRKRQKIVSRK